MKSTIVLAAFLASVYAYHDPDLNYHLSQVQNVQGCGDSGYSYPAPAVQLTTSGVQAKSAPLYTHSISSEYSGGYSNGAGYSQSVLFQPQAIKVQPSISYQAPTTTYSAQSEEHGYATSSGLSSASTQGTVTPLATYAQAPIIAKITAAPLQAKYSLSPVRTSYATQNLVAQQSSYSSGSYAKASLNSFNTVHPSGPVVSQVYAAPSSGYATSPSLRQQSPQVFSSAYSEESSKSNQYSQQSGSASAAVVAPVTSYRAPVVAQYSAPTVSHVSAPAVVQYAAPVVTQHSTPAAQFSSSVSHYSAPAVTHYSAPAAHYASVSHYSAPVITQHAAPVITQHATPVITQHAAPVITHHAAPVITHHAAPVITHHAAPVITHHAAPVITQHVAHVAAPAAVAVAPIAQAAHVAHVGHITTASHGAKNVHTDFLENYDAHPRYAYEYSVNDPHTGDIKQQKEERDGEVVKGQYSLVEPDGSVRTVNYVADWETGFHADVHNSKDNHH